MSGPGAEIAARRRPPVRQVPRAVRRPSTATTATPTESGTAIGLRVRGESNREPRSCDLRRGVATLFNACFGFGALRKVPGGRRALDSIEVIHGVRTRTDAAARIRAAASAARDGEATPLPWIRRFRSFEASSTHRVRAARRDNRDGRTGRVHRHGTERRCPSEQRSRGSLSWRRLELRELLRARFRSPLAQVPHRCQDQPKPPRLHRSRTLFNPGEMLSVILKNDHSGVLTQRSA